MDVTTSSIPGLPACGLAASVRYEMYSAAPDGGLYGSLDGTVNVCAAHADAAREAISGAGLTPHRLPLLVAARQVCGSGYDFLTHASREVPAVE